MRGNPSAKSLGNSFAGRDLALPLGRQARIRLSGGQ